MLEMMTASLLKKISEPGLEIDPEVFQKLLASDGAANDFFGFSIDASTDGTTIVVGARADDDKGTDSGSVYIFTKQTGGSYLQTQKLVPSDGAAGDAFGCSVSTSADGSTIIVGAFYDDDKGSNSGSAYIYKKQTNGNYLQSQKLVASDGVVNDYFGRSVSISEDSSTIVVGAYGDDDKGADSGSAYIFTKQANETYLQTQKLVASDGAAGDRFSWSISISGNSSTIVVCAYLDDDKGSDSGSAYVFTQQANGSYLQSQKLVASDGAANDAFGMSVAISEDGSTIIAGALRSIGNVSGSGSVYIFTKQANGTYIQTQKLVASDGAVDDYFGRSATVSSDGSTIVVGAYRDDDKGLDSGSAYVFTKQADGSYLETFKLVPSDGATNDGFGWTVCVSQTSVVIGAYNHLGKGAVYVY